MPQTYSLVQTTFACKAAATIFLSPLKNALKQTTEKKCQISALLSQSRQSPEGLIFNNLMVITQINPEGCSVFCLPWMVESNGDPVSSMEIWSCMLPRDFLEKWMHSLISLENGDQFSQDDIVQTYRVYVYFASLYGFWEAIRGTASLLTSSFTISAPAGTVSSSRNAVTSGRNWPNETQLFLHSWHIQTDEVA